MRRLRSLKSRVYFVLQLGYFKAKCLFFTFELTDVAEDARFVQEQHFERRKCDQVRSIENQTVLKQQRMILELFNYRNCDAEERKVLNEKAEQAAVICGKPIYIFREIKEHLDKNRIVSPPYSFMQDTVGAAISSEQNRLASILRTELQPSAVEALNNLLDDSEGLHEITLLKREPKDFSTSEIKREIQRGEQIADLYRLAEKLLPVLRISNESVKYYASLVGYYSVFRLKRFDEWVVQVYLLCFVFHRYQRLNDNLINCLIHNVRKYIDESKKAAKEMVYEHLVENNQNLRKAGEVLKLFSNDDIAASTLFQDVQEKAFEILDRRKLELVADHLSTKAQFDETAFQWQHVDKLAGQFKRNLRPVLSAVEFEGTPGRDAIIEAAEFLKAAFEKQKAIGHYAEDAVPTRFIPESVKRYIYGAGKGRLIPDRYEFLFFKHLRNGLEAGDIFCRHTTRFRSLDDDLISDENWKHKDKLIEESGLTALNQPVSKHLSELKRRLENRITEVNQRIADGENEHFQVKKQGQQVRWSLKYPSDAESVNHPVFDALSQVDIGSVLQFTNQHCNFMDHFDHVLGRYVKQSFDETSITACLIAWATNMGLGRMAEISDIGYNTLSSTSDNFIRLETLKAANDCVSNAIAEFPIMRHYDIAETVHSSSDGQKFETRIPTINARHSPKYFGLKKGVVAYTLVANHIPVNARIIGANEHESHFVFDVLYNNTTDVQPEVHSTDTHGTNEVNFAILHTFGYQFAPRYKDIFETVSTSLYGFRHPSQYDDNFVLKPIRKINEDLIADEWDNFQRIMVSLALKTTTQNIIVGKLSAYARRNKTRRALWEYDNIIKSLYLLDYVDSPPLRKNVQKALNRGESYHQLRRAVAYANFGKLRFKSEHDQQIWQECSRLITNCIIFYNATLLSRLLQHAEDTGDEEVADMLKQVSPVAWQHINFYGRYEFGKQPNAIDLEAIIEKLVKLRFESGLASPI